MIPCDWCGYKHKHHPDCFEALVASVNYKEPGMSTSCIDCPEYDEEALRGHLKTFNGEPVRSFREHRKSLTERSRGSERQVGGSHYRDMIITPREFGYANNLDFDQINVIKYICRHETKNGREDLQKAIHYIELMIERLYPDER